MDKMLALFEEFVMKGILMTEAALAQEVDADKMVFFADNRERLLQVVDKISQDLDWTAISTEKKDFLSQQISYLKKLDEQIIVKLQEHQQEVKQDIERTHRQKESIKGYNLTDLK
jgi:hypothetical protein